MASINETRAFGPAITVPNNIATVKQKIMTSYLTIKL